MYKGMIFNRNVRIVNFRDIKNWKEYYKYDYIIWQNSCIYERTIGEYLCMNH